MGKQFKTYQQVNLGHMCIGMKPLYKVLEGLDSEELLELGLARGGFGLYISSRAEDFSTTIETYKNVEEPITISSQNPENIKRLAQTLSDLLPIAQELRQI